MSSAARAILHPSFGVLRKVDAAAASRTYAVAMLKRLLAAFRPIDGWLALGFVAAAAIEAVIRYRHEPGLLVGNLSGAPTFGCLAVRRTRPLLTVSIMTVVFSVGSLVEAVLAPHRSGDEVVPIFALLVASYSLGAYATRRHLL